MVTYKFHSSLPPTAHVTAMDTARKKFRADIQKSYRQKGYDTPLLRRDTKNKDAFSSFRGLHDYTFRFFHKKAKITIDVLLENIKPESPTYVIKVDRRFSRMATFAAPLLGLLLIVAWLLGSNGQLPDGALGEGIRLGVIALILGFVVFSLTRGRAKKFKKASSKTEGESDTLGDEMAHALATLLVEHVNDKQDDLGISGATLEIPPEPSSGVEVVYEDDLDLDELDDSDFEPDEDGDALVYDIECPSCDTTLEVEGQEGELEIECPICGTEFDVEF